MWNAIIRKFTNLLYFVPLKLRQFRSEHPDERVIVAGGSKARKLDGDQEIERGLGWVFAKRATLILSDRAIICGSWTIPLSSIDDATLLRTSGMFSEAFVLKVATNSGEHYQFGLPYDPRWEEQNVLEANVDETEIAYSMFSLAIRILLVAFIVWQMVELVGLEV